MKSAGVVSLLEMNVFSNRRFGSGLKLRDYLATKLATLSAIVNRLIVAVFPPLRATIKANTRSYAERRPIALAATIRLCIVFSAVVVGMMFGSPINTQAQCTSVASGNWSAPATWTSCGGGTPGASNNVTIALADTVTLDTNTSNLASLSVTGTLTVGNDATARTITVTGDVSIASGGTIAPGTDANHTMSIGGSLTNAGTFDGAPTGARTIDVTFNGSANQSVSGAGATTRFNTITLNNSGAASNNILEISSTNFAAASGFLTLTQGILKVSGSFSLTNTFFLAPAYSINASSGIWLNNPSVAVSGQNGDPILSGLLRVTQGTYNVGTVADNDLTYATGSTIDIQGGALNVTGALQGTTVVVGAGGTTNTITYSQSGGTVTVATVNVTLLAKSAGSFDVKAAGSSFTMSAGSIVMQNPSSVAADCIIGAGLGSVTGGTVQFGNSSTTIAKSFNYSDLNPRIQRDRQGRHPLIIFTPSGYSNNHQGCVSDRVGSRLRRAK